MQNLYDAINELSHSDAQALQKMLNDKLDLVEQSNITGKVFVLTGKLSITRAKMSEIIKRHGGIVSTKVSRQTDFLLVGENPGSKWGKGQVLSVPCLNETEFFELLAGKDN